MIERLRSLFERPDFWLAAAALVLPFGWALLVFRLEPVRVRLAPVRARLRPRR